MADLHSHARFIVVLVAAFLVICMGAAAFNYLVDPYGLFGTPRLTEFNELKPTAAERVRVTKPYMAKRAQPRVVIGGNSRPEMGLDPQSACWDKADQPVFNAAIPGADVFMQVRYAQHAAERGGAKRILFGVDFLDFLVDASRPTGKPDWERLGNSYAGRVRAGADTNGMPEIVQQAEDTLSGLFSMATLGDSITTLAAQRDVYSATRREDGFNPAQDYMPIIRNEGQAVLFLQKNTELRSRLQPGNLGILDVNGEQTLPLLALGELLQWAKPRGIEVILFINPYHSDYLVQIAINGKWALLEEWKRQLTAIADEHVVPLWDFNSIDPYSTESPPPRSDRRTVLNWYWEPAHYRRELGDLMLASMLNRECGRRQASTKFGTQLTPPVLERHLDALGVALAQFVEKKPDVTTRLRRGEATR